MIVAVVLFGMLTLALILTLLRVACLCDSVRFLRFELEAAGELLERREERIEVLHKASTAAESELSREAACSRIAAAQFDNAMKMKDAAEGKLTQLRMDSTKALESFQAVLTDIFGADTCKPLEQRLREAFDKNGIREI